ncbi:MAG: glycoside hydrolase family 31 protein [Fimbriimonas sp.]
MALSIERSATLVPLLEGERWWGGAVQDGALMPFGTAPYARDLRVDHGGNQAVPLLVSSHGRYLWSDAAFGFAFEAGRLRIEGAGAVLESGFSGLAGAFRAASRRHFPPKGTMPDPIAFAAPQFNTWMEMGYEPTQDAVLVYAQSILDHGLSPGVLILDDGWSEGYGDWRFHPGRFPDPGAMMRRLTEMGFAVMLWIVPFVSPDGPVARDLAKRGWLLRDREGKTAIRPWWNGHSALLDLTHPQAVAWLGERLDALVERYGVAGFKLDAGDPDAFRTDDRAHAPTDPVGYCETWGALGERYRLCEYRACWKRGGGPSIQRLRDKHHRWGRDGLADLIPNALAQGLAGHPFVCPDMVGGGDIGTSFGTAVDPELFVRTAQCSALFPMVQFSIAPWRVLDETHWRHCAEAIRLRERFGPELLRLAQNAARTGEPMIRHLGYAYPDGGYEGIADQFLLGDDILVAPVLEPGARMRRVAIPSGEWVSDRDERFVGPGDASVEAPLDRLPWFRRTR